MRLELKIGLYIKRTGSILKPAKRAPGLSYVCFPVNSYSEYFVFIIGVNVPIQEWSIFIQKERGCFNAA
jgi:hypothetical protein